MSTITFKTPLTADERTLFEDEFKKLDKENLGIVTGEAAKPLFGGSGLSPQILSQIWALVDYNNKGFLNLDEFCAALRVMGHLQHYPTLPVTADLYAQPSVKLPVLNGSVSPLVQTSTATVQSTAPAGHGQSQSQIPPASAQDISKFSQLYERAANGTPTLAGDKAKEIFLKARLPNQVLGSVWGLCDRNASGSLTKSEFIMAMHLIQLLMTNSPSVNPLPASLSPHLWTSVEAIDSLPPAAPLSANSTGRSSLTRQGTISRLSSGVFTNASTDWLLSFEKKQQFDAIFDSLDKSHAGSLSSQVLVPFFLSSRLNQETLASIWDLADIHNNAEFSKVEFAIAMFLIQKKNAGVQLPDVIPDQLLQSPALGLYPAQQQAQIAVPSRDTKPSFTEVQSPPQQMRNNSNNGSLNDLLTLNNSFSPPAQQPLQQRQSSNALGQDSSGVSRSSLSSVPAVTRNHSGQPDWSHEVIKEADEDMAFSNTGPQPQAQQPQVQQSQAPQPQVPQQQFQTQHYFQQEQQSQPQHSATNTAQPGQNRSVSQPSVSLSSVPNFASLGMPVTAVASAAGAIAGGAIGAMSSGSRRQNNDLYADSEASAQLSSATTEMANLSNQVTSLSKQASITNDKKSRAEQELRRVNEMKSSIEMKLETLRSTHEANVKKTEELEGQLAEANRVTEALNQQLSVTEGNYHAVESKVSSLTAELEQAQQRNAQLKEQISGLNTMTSTLQAQLNEKQQDVKQQRSLVDVNSKQLEVGQLTVSNLETEIKGLIEKSEVYLTKRKELDDYQKKVEEQHSQLETKYAELETKNNDLNTRTQALDERNKQIEEQERLYEEHVAKLQEMFDDLSKRKTDLEKAEDDLEQQHIEYARNIQLLTEKQISLGMGEIPKEIPSSEKKETLQSGHTMNEGEVSKFVEDTVANSKLGHRTYEDEDAPESEVFDKDVPTTGSQTEADDDSDERARVNETDRTLQADRFEGDLNEYGIPRSQSLTSSVANNAPQSVIDDVELAQTLEEASGPNVSEGKTNPIAHSEIPGQWENNEAYLGEEEQPNPAIESNLDKSTSKAGTRQISQTSKEEISTQIPSVIQQTSKEVVIPPSNTQPNTSEIDEEFPPIKELDINESDSSSSDDEFQDTKDQIPIANADRPSTAPVKDDFDDAFNGLEQAPNEEDLNLEIDDDQNEESMEEFEKIDHKDLDEELQLNGFTGTSLGNGPNDLKPGSEVSSPKPVTTTEDVTNDEWDEIFAGFGNAKQNTPKSTGAAFSIQQPVAMNLGTSNLKPPINRKVATTPKSLAIEELSGMGFTEEEARNALDKCNWDLEAATNFLLDSA